jgi:TnpA family transposase
LADAESLLRRFTRANALHPAYKALAELGKAIKTIFLCRYLGSEELRQEVNEGLNVVESWNATNGFVFYGRAGELTTNRKDDQEMSLLCLHLLQASLVYVNTLMIQRVLTEKQWLERMTPRDLSALSPLLTQHINPYGRFDLDMTARIPIETSFETVA